MISNADKCIASKAFALALLAGIALPVVAGCSVETASQGPQEKARNESQALSGLGGGGGVDCSSQAPVNADPLSTTSSHVTPGASYTPYGSPTPPQSNTNAGSPGICAQALLNHGCSNGTLYSPALAGDTNYYMWTTCPAGTGSSVDGWDYGTFQNLQGYIWNYYNGSWGLGWIDAYDFQAWNAYYQWHWDGSSWVGLGWSGGTTWSGWVYQPCAAGLAQEVTRQSMCWNTGAVNNYGYCVSQCSYAPSGYEYDDFDPNCGSSCPRGS
jgi:hypothetical protein